jgi:hypothetical protein
MSELAFEELEFDVEMHSVLSNPTIKPSEILMHKAMKVCIQRFLRHFIAV